MTNLTLLAQAADIAIEKKFNIIKGNSSYQKKIQDMTTLAPYASNLVDASALKNYLLTNISELENLSSLFDDEKCVNALDKMANIELYEKLSSFSPKDIKKAANFHDNAYIIYLNMYLNRLIRMHNISVVPTVDYRNNYSSFSQEASHDVLKKLMEIDESLLLPLLFVDGYTLDVEDVKGSLERLANPSTNALVNYITQYHKVNAKDLANVDAKNILSLLNKIFLTKIVPLDESKAHERMKRVVSLLIQDNFDKKRLRGFYNNVTSDFFDGNMSVLTYMNAAMTNKYTDLIEKAPLSYNAIITYAIANRKFAFLTLLSDNIDAAIDKTSYRSFLLEECVYTKYINLNEINKSDLFSLLEMTSVPRLDIKDCITPKELIALCNSNVGDICLLYNKLTCKVDNKLAILRQIQNLRNTSNESDFSFNSFSNKELETLAANLSIMNLGRRIEKMPFEVSKETLINVLTLGNEYDTLVSEAASDVELQFIYRNRNTINKEVSLNENINNFTETDNDCKELFEVMNLSNEFMTANNKTIREFCINGNATIVMTFYRHIKYMSNENRENQRTSILRIAKAAMAGQMEKFKFFDLNSEIEYELSENEKKSWINNKTLRSGEFSAYETYSFNDTMLLGVLPSHTCMNYGDGGYRHCLLANFDSNKKFFFATKNGKIVARAIIRLTKSIKMNELAKFGKVEFLDVENETSASCESGKTEKLTLFIERCYTAHLDAKEELKVKNMFIQMLMEKANEMNARLLATEYSYDDCNGLEDCRMKVFISHTKNEFQYMDSFGGTNSYNNEATFIDCCCMMPKNQL